MLTPEQIKAFLEQNRAPHEDRRRLEAIAKLPEATRTVAYALIDRDEHGERLTKPGQLHDHADWSLRQRQNAAHLDALPLDQRMQVFAIFFPTLAPSVELAWQLQQRLPYLESWSGWALFRAPSQPAATCSVRGGWLRNAMGAFGAYHQDICWLASYAPYLGYGARLLGPLFAAVIDGDPVHGDEVLDILIRSARGEHETGAMGRHVASGLLAAARPEGWECVERLLLGAQREEGVRQVILESLAVAHPLALRRLLRLILEHDLVRFSAITRAVNGWLGTGWDSAQSAVVTRTLVQLTTLLDGPKACDDALTRGSGEAAYLALWAMAVEDVYAAIPRAAELMEAAEVERRFAAVHLLANARLPEGHSLLLGALRDPDPRIVARACAGLAHQGALLSQEESAFERIEAALPHLPGHPAPVKPLLWNEPAAPVQREQIADLLLSCLGSRSPARLIPALDRLSKYGRMRAAEALARHDLDDRHIRGALVTLLGDRASWVRQRVTQLLSAAPPRPDEVPALEALLARKSPDLRRGLLNLLLALPDEAALASSDRLLVARDERQRLAGLELLRLLSEAERAPAECLARAAAYQNRQRTLSAAEQTLLTALRAVGSAPPSLENALGLVNLDECTVPPAPVERPHAWTSPAAVAALLALDALVHVHRAVAYTWEHRGVKEEVLLGAADWRFPAPDPAVPIAQDVARLPLTHLWRTWAEERPPTQRDDDGLEFARMALQSQHIGADETRAVLASLGEPDAPRLSLRYPRQVRLLTQWLMRLYPAPGQADFLLDHLETVLATLPAAQVSEPTDPPRFRPPYQRLEEAVALARTQSVWMDSQWTAAHAARLWRLLQWSTTLVERPHLRYPPTLRESLAAHQAGACNETDLTLQFLGPRMGTGYQSTRFAELSQLSARKQDPLLFQYPIIAEISQHCVQRVLEVELARGEMPSSACAR